MKDYSQFGEQRFILECLGYIGASEGPVRQGHFLDIGAFHPTVFSNTRALYELGWKGVMIEPSPAPSLALLLEYGKEERITLVQAAVAIEPSMVEMFITDDAVSTSDKKSFELWKDATKFHGKLMVPAITLWDIANRWGGFDFINLDAEGCSVDLFRHAIETLGWRPRCWAVEIDGRQEELAHIAEGAGYKSVNDVSFGTLGNGTNSVLVLK